MIIRARRGNVASLRLLLLRRHLLWVRTPLLLRLLLRRNGGSGNG